MTRYDLRERSSNHTRYITPVVAAFIFFTYTYHHACIPRKVRQKCTNAHSQFAGTFRSHVIGGEPIAINRAQILTPSCY